MGYIFAADSIYTSPFILNQSDLKPGASLLNDSTEILHVLAQFFCGGREPQFLDLDYKIQPTFPIMRQSFTAIDRGTAEKAWRNKKISRVKQKPVRNSRSGRPKTNVKRSSLPAGICQLEAVINLVTVCRPIPVVFLTSWRFAEDCGKHLGVMMHRCLHGLQALGTSPTISSKPPLTSLFGFVRQFAFRKPTPAHRTSLSSINSILTAVGLADPPV